MDSTMRALETIETRAHRARPLALERLSAIVGDTLARELISQSSQSLSSHPQDSRFPATARLTANFHPDRIAAAGHTVAEGLLGDGRYRSQWATGISSGGRTAMPGGDRQRFEQQLFADTYDDMDPETIEFPIYGALDLLRDPHGGSPRFGSCYLIVATHVLNRTTLCVGDSHIGASDVGTWREPASILAGLAEQAARNELLDRPLGVPHLQQALEGRFELNKPSRDLDGYIEAQIHGGLDLATDVQAIVADPSFRHTPVGANLQATADRYGFGLRWHCGSELAVANVPSDFRGDAMPALAKQCARPDDTIDAHAIGRVAPMTAPPPPTPNGDAGDSQAQQVKYLWHTLLAHGDTAEPQQPPQLD